MRRERKKLGADDEGLEAESGCWVWIREMWSILRFCETVAYGDIGTEISGASNGGAKSYFFSFLPSRS